MKYVTDAVLLIGMVLFTAFLGCNLGDGKKAGKEGDNSGEVILRYYAVAGYSWLPDCNNACTFEYYDRCLHVNMLDFLAGISDEELQPAGPRAT